jgi:pimeloyl-ACP methyl ester carboxylesterase
MDATAGLYSSPLANLQRDDECGRSTKGLKSIGTITTKDGTEIFYKDWGNGQPLFFHHGWPLSADDWDSQMMFFLAHGYRVIAHDRRGHGRSTQTANGHDMDTYAADVAEVVKHLDLKDAIHIGHSTGGGEVTRYVAKYGKGRVIKAVLISAIPPTFMQSERNPDGVPKEVVDGIRDGTANHRAQFYKDITIPFYAVGKTVEAWHAEVLSRAAPRNADDPCGVDQCRSAGFYQVVTRGGVPIHFVMAGLRPGHPRLSWL